MGARPHIVTRWRSVSASSVLEAAGQSLADIASEDGLTDGDLGAELGRSADMAARYRTALADMPMTVFVRACQRWDGRFANRVLGLVGMKVTPVAGERQNDRRLASVLARLQAAISEALENDDIIDEGELAGMRALMCEAQGEIDARLARPALKAVGE